MNGLLHWYELYHNQMKVLGVVIDNGNIVKAVRDEFGSERYIGCVAHTIHLVAQDVLEGMKNLLSVVKTIVTFFKQSLNAADALRKAQGDEAVFLTDGTSFNIVPIWTFFYKEYVFVANNVDALAFDVFKHTKERVIPLEGEPRQGDRVPTTKSAPKVGSESVTGPKVSPATTRPEQKAPASNKVASQKPSTSVSVTPASGGSSLRAKKDEADSSKRKSPFELA